MPLTPPPEADTRPLFRPVSSALVGLLRDLPPAGWLRPTLAPSWTVRDLVAHLTDLAVRRLSFHRDGHVPPPPPFPIASPRDFVRFINRINHDWVATSERLSTRVLTDHFERASTELADFFEGQSLEAPGLFGVSWAGEMTSAGWLDIGREFVELWHHQMQVRLAVGAAPLDDSRYLDAALVVAARSLPHACRNIGASGDVISIVVEGAAPDGWTLQRSEQGWTLSAGRADRADASMSLGADAWWRLLFNALPASEARLVATEGRTELLAPIFGARAVIV